MTKMSAFDETIADGLIILWDKYLLYCEEQIRKNDELNRRMQEQYDKEYKKQSKKLRMFIAYNPPTLRSIYEQPNFAGFMQWIKEEKKK